jgi:hypothetical protein
VCCKRLATSRISARLKKKRLDLQAAAIEKSEKTQGRALKEQRILVRPSLEGIAFTFK